MAPDKLYPTDPVLTAVDTMFEPITDEEMSIAQFHNALCVYIRRRFNDGVAIPLGDNKDGFLCRHVTQYKIVIS